MSDSEWAAKCGKAEADNAFLKIQNKKLLAWVDELQAKLDAVKALPDKWLAEEYRFFVSDCADHLKAAIGEQDE